MLKNNKKTGIKNLLLKIPVFLSTYLSYFKINFPIEIEESKNQSI